MLRSVIRDMMHDTARSIVLLRPITTTLGGLDALYVWYCSASLFLQRPSRLDRLLFMLMQGEKNGSKPPAFQTWKLVTLYFL